MKKIILNISLIIFIFSFTSQARAACALGLEGDGLYLYGEEWGHGCAYKFDPTKEQFLPFKIEKESYYNKLGLEAIELPNRYKICELTPSKKRKEIVSITCKFENQTYKKTVTLKNRDLRFGTVQIGWQIFKDEDGLKVPIVLDAGEGGYDQLGFVIFRSPKDSTYVADSFDCSRGGGVDRYKFKDKIICLQPDHSTFTAISPPSKNADAFPAPCEKPKTILQYQSSLWGVAEGKKESLTICKYADDLKSTKKAFRLEIDINATLAKVFHPRIPESVQVKSFDTFNEEIDNGGWVGIDIQLKKPITTISKAENCHYNFASPNCKEMEAKNCEELKIDEKFSLKKACAKYYFTTTVTKEDGKNYLESITIPKELVVLKLKTLP